MSHITPLKRSGGYSLEVIERMCQDNGWILTQEKTFRSYQHGQACDFAITVPGCEYQIGVAQGAEGYELRFDVWYRGGLAKVVGEDGLALEDNYNLTNAKMTAERYGHTWEECLSDQGERQLVVTLSESALGGESPY